MSLNTSQELLSSESDLDSQPIRQKRVLKGTSAVSSSSPSNEGQFGNEPTQTINNTKKVSSRASTPAKKTNGVRTKRLKSQRKVDSSSASATSSMDGEAPESSATSPFSTSSRRIASPQSFNGSGDTSDEDSPFLPNTTNRDDDTDVTSIEEDIELGFQQNNPRQTGCCCIKGLVELLKVASFSYINFALIFVPFPIIIYLAGWNRGILFILSYITLYPISTFLNSVVASSNYFFPNWISVLFKLCLRNALAIILGSVAVHHNMERMVQGMVIGLLIHRLLLMFGLSVTVAGSRSKSIRVDEKNVRVAVSVLYLAIIMLSLPSFFKLSSPDSGALGLLKISRWSAVSLFFLLIFFLFYSLKTETKFWIHTEQIVPQLRISLITAIVVLLLGLGMGIISTWFFVISSNWVTQNWGIGQTFIAGIMVPMALNAADFTNYAKMAFAGNIKPTTLDVIRSSLEVCLFVAPILVIAAWMGAKSVGLTFFGIGSVSGVLAIINLGIMLSALKVTWIQGVMMSFAYLLMTVGFFLQNE